MPNIYTLFRQSAILGAILFSAYLIGSETPFYFGGHTSSFSQGLPPLEQRQAIAATQAAQPHSSIISLTLKDIREAIANPHRQLMGQEFFPNYTTIIVIGDAESGLQVADYAFLLENFPHGVEFLYAPAEKISKILALWGSNNKERNKEIVAQKIREFSK